MGGKHTKQVDTASNKPNSDSDKTPSKEGKDRPAITRRSSRKGNSNLPTTGLQTDWLAYSRSNDQLPDSLLINKQRTIDEDDARFMLEAIKQHPAMNALDNETL